jgi:MFS family permease
MTEPTAESTLQSTGQPTVGPTLQSTQVNDPATLARQRWVLATLCLGMFMAMLDNVVVSNALPRIDRDLGAGITGLQWVVEAYSLVFAALLLTGGTLGDRFGRRRFYLGGLALFTLGSAISALAPDLALLIVGRAVQGIGAAALIPQSLAILRVTYPEADRQARAFALWSAVSALGLALGPAIGGPLVDAFGSSMRSAGPVHSGSTSRSEWPRSWSAAG